MPQFFFALLLTLSADTVNIDSLQSENAWLHGRWLHVAVSSDTATTMESEQRKPPRQKHMLVFQPDGELRRYSPHKGWAKLLMDVDVTEDTVQLCPQTQAPVSLMAEKTDEGLLKVCMPKYGDFYYKKLDPKIRLEEIDFGQPPSEKPHMTSHSANPGE